MQVVQSEVVLSYNWRPKLVDKLVSIPARRKLVCSSRDLANTLKMKLEGARRGSLQESSDAPNATQQNETRLTPQRNVHIMHMPPPNQAMT